MSTHPTGSNDQLRRPNVFRRVERAVGQDLRVVFVLHELPPVHVQFDRRHVDRDDVVVPPPVAYFRKPPAPLARLERIRVDARSGRPPQKQNQSAAVDMQGVVLPVHAFEKKQIPAKQTEEQRRRRRTKMESKESLLLLHSLSQLLNN